MTMWQGIILCSEGAFLCSQAFAIHARLSEIKAMLKHGTYKGSIK